MKKENLCLHLELTITGIHIIMNTETKAVLPIVVRPERLRFTKSNHYLGGGGYFFVFLIISNNNETMILSIISTIDSISKSLIHTPLSFFWISYVNKILVKNRGKVPSVKKMEGLTAYLYMVAPWTQVYQRISE